MAELVARLMPYRRLVERADQNRWLRWGVYVLVVLSPVLMLAFAGVVLEIDYRYLVPFFNDATVYWHQAKTFAAVGFDGGYYTSAEAPARIPGIHFYAWGPFVPMLYGSIGWLFGWYPGSMVVINLVLLVGALALFVYAVRPVWWKALLIPLVYAHSMIFWLHISMSMVVILHYAIAVALAGCFYRLVQGCVGTVWRGWWVGTGLLIIAASLLIPIWAPVAIVYFLVAFRGRAWSWVLVAVGLGVVLFGAATLLYILTAAPFLNTLPPFLPLLGQDLGAALQSWVGMLERNLSVFFNDYWLYATTMRIGAVLIIAAALWNVLRRPWAESWSQSASAHSLSKNFDWTMHLANLVPVLVLYLTIYFQFEQMIRQLAPRMVLSSLLLLMYGRLRLLAVVVLVSSLGMIPGYHFAIRQFRDSVSPDSYGLYETWRPRLQRVLEHVPNAPSPWCNSLVLTDPYFFSPRLGVLMAVPGGIGLTLKSPAIPERARYGLLDDETYREYGRDANLVLLMEVPGGGLYLNLDSDCPLPPDDVLERARNAG